MRTITLSKSGVNKLRSHHRELKHSDFDGPLRSLTPGEWCLMASVGMEWVGYINPLIDEKYICAYVISLDPEEVNLSPEEMIKDRITKAFHRRRTFKGYEVNSRIFYGASDGLPGLIIDKFTNAVIIQINTAGIDRFRDIIKNHLENLTKASCYFLDNQKYRDKEGLPSFETVPLPDIMVNENDLKFKIRPAVLQKVGFYYDHRENRYHLRLLLSRLGREFKKGVDLFSYVGAWGMSALKAGVHELTFIDQSDLAFEVEEGLKMNGFEGRGRYQRGDVFSFLDHEITLKNKFDLILSDPPAFAKSALQKKQALDGYTKLHRKIFKLISPGGLVTFSSCTHYVTHGEFQKNILDAAEKEGKEIQLIFSGMQGWDHPIKSFEDRSNYIKSYFYVVE